MFKKYFWSFFFVLGVFGLDRISKISIINLLENSSHDNIFITNFLSLNLIWNEGIAFGLFSFDQKIYYNFLTLIIVLVTTVILWMIIKTRGVEKIAFMMVFGGSIGNIFDRIYYSSVPDFIDFHIGNFHWFIFNVADIFITSGVMLLIYLEFFKKKYD
tara:strand:+ start:596 stop:1069 length:474 start_codon:yes stop_codon:yes gene_type:complete